MSAVFLDCDCTLIVSNSSVSSVVSDDDRPLLLSFPLCNFTQAARVLAAAGVSPSSGLEGQQHSVPSTPQVVPTYGGGSVSTEGQQDPGVGGYAFVVPPSPAPGVGDDVPVMTWGDIEGTPLILDPQQTPLDMTPGTSKYVCVLCMRTFTPTLSVRCCVGR